MAKKNFIYFKYLLPNYLKKIEKPVTFFGKVLGSKMDYYVATHVAGEAEEE